MILISLRSKLSSTHREHERTRVMMMYELFVKLLLQEFGSQLGGSWAYVLRDVIYTLLNFMQSHDPTKV